MSYLYKFFLGKKYADGTIDYVGDESITIRSYSSGFFNDEFLSPFDYVAESEMREKLKKYMETTGWNDEPIIRKLMYLSFDDFFKIDRNYIKSGYFLAEDVSEYLKSEDKYYFDGFYNSLDPIMYSSLVRTRPETIIRDSQRYEGEKEVLRGANDYMWFAYPDYSSIQYMAEEMASIIMFIRDNSKLEEGEEFLILEEYK